MTRRAEPRGSHPTAKRLTISLDGTWEVGESNADDTPPTAYGHRAPVPGLLFSAEPPFPDIGRFASREFQYNNYMAGLISGGIVQVPVDEAAKAHPAGIAYQYRDYFWYRRSFRAPSTREHAILEVLKAQFGSKVWLNGVCIGGRNSGFTAGFYDVSAAIRWEADNELVVRVGAHPGVLPEGNARNTDFEKEFWHPGIWDSVELHCFDGPAIRSVQIAPRVNPREVVVETVLENIGAASAKVPLHHRVLAADGATVLGEHRETIALAPSERRTLRCTIALPGAELWRPGAPVLYRLESATAGDSVSTRFGLREFRFDTFTKRSYLNGEPVFLRGCGVALHRFFEDPLCGTLPWNEQWVRKLLGDGPRRMHWNMLKFTIGPVPRKWFDIADELGLMVVYEFPIWTLTPEVFFGYEREFDRAVLKQEMGDWVRDNWNHPSLIYWNTNLESYLPWLAEEILPDVRALDLSNRAWGDGWGPPPESDDPMEDHPYEFSANGIPGRPNFDMVQLESRGAFERPHLGSTPSGHASVIAEYGWLWLTRDGDPTLLTEAVYPTLPYPTSTPAQRIETACYLLAGLTEYWRSFRHYTGVGFYGYLAGSGPRPYTSDYFADIEQLRLHPAFEDYVGEAFKPLGVYLNFWRRELQAGAEQEFIVMLCNDEPVPVRGELILMLESPTRTVELGRKPFALGRLGQQTLRLLVRLPADLGAYTLSARALAVDQSVTVSRRWLSLEKSVPQPPRLGESEAQFGQAFSD